MITLFRRLTLGSVILMALLGFSMPTTHAQTHTLISSPNTAAHAASLFPSRVKPDVPDIPCLDVSQSLLFSRQVVPAPRLPGTAVLLTLWLYAINRCEGRVGNLTIDGVLNSTCPAGYFSGKELIRYQGGRYQILRSGKGAGDEYIEGTGCFLYKDGIPVASTLPTRLTVTVSASGDYLDGPPGGQGATDTGEKVILAWP